MDITILAHAKATATAMVTAVTAMEVMATVTAAVAVVMVGTVDTVVIEATGITKNAPSEPELVHVSFRAKTCLRKTFWQT